MSIISDHMRFDEYVLAKKAIHVDQIQPYFCRFCVVPMLFDVQFMVRYVIPTVAHTAIHRSVINPMHSSHSSVSPIATDGTESKYVHFWNNASITLSTAWKSGTTNG